MARVDEVLADPVIFTREPERAAKYVRERAHLEKKLVRTEELWLELSAELEGT